MTGPRIAASVRIRCCVPFCKRTMLAEEDSEFVCPKHLRAVPKRTYREYESAWDAATAADRSGNQDPAVFQRVTQAFERVKTLAIAVAFP